MTLQSPKQARISVDQLRRGVYQVGRALLTPHPSFSNGALAASIAVENERLQQGKPLLDVWFEVTSSFGTAYIIEGSNGSGEYRRKLPPDVCPESVVKVSLPPGVLPVSDLLLQIEGLLNKFQETAQFLDEPTNTVLELQGGESAQVQTGELLSLTGNIRLATTPLYDERITSQLIGLFDDARQRYTNTQDFSHVKESLSLARKTTETLRESLSSDGLLTSFFMVFHDLCNAILEWRINSKMAANPAQDEYVGRVAELRNASKLAPEHLLGFAVARALRCGALPVIVEHANQYFRKGQDLIDEALCAPTRDLHGDALYRAAIFLFSSRQLFGILLKSAPLLPDLNVKQIKNLSNVSEEDNVKVQDALLFILRNRGDELLNAQRDRFRQLAVQKGSGAVRSKITELIEQKFYYPRIFKGCLEGGEIPAD